MRTACTVAPVRKPRACRPAGMLGLRAACSRAGSRRVGAATAMQARSLPSEVHAEACHSVTAHSASAGQVRAPDGGPPGRGARGHRGAAAHMAGIQRARQRRQEADSARRVGPDADLAARRADAPALNRAGQRQGVRSGWGCPAWTGLLLGPVGCHSAGSAAPNPAPVCGSALRSICCWVSCRRRAGAVLTNYYNGPGCRARSFVPALLLEAFASRLSCSNRAGRGRPAARAKAKAD